MPSAVSQPVQFLCHQEMGSSPSEMEDSTSRVAAGHRSTMKAHTLPGLPCHSRCNEIMLFGKYLRPSSAAWAHGPAALSPFHWQHVAKAHPTWLLRTVHKFCCLSWLLPLYLPSYNGPRLHVQLEQSFLLVWEKCGGKAWCWPVAVYAVSDVLHAFLFACLEGLAALLSS